MTARSLAQSLKQSFKRSLGEVMELMNPKRRKFKINEVPVQQIQETVQNGDFSLGYTCQCTTKSGKEPGFLLKWYRKPYPRKHLELVQHFHHRKWGPALLCVLPVDQQRMSDQKELHYDGFVTRRFPQNYEFYLRKLQDLPAENDQLDLEIRLIQVIKEIASEGLCLMDLKPDNIVINASSTEALIIDLDPSYIKTYAHACSRDEANRIGRGFEKLMLALLAGHIFSIDGPKKKSTSLIRRAFFFANAGRSNPNFGKEKREEAENDTVKAIIDLTESFWSDLGAFEDLSFDVESGTSIIRRILSLCESIKNQKPQFEHQLFAKFRGRPERTPTLCRIQDVQVDNGAFQLDPFEEEPPLCRIDDGGHASAMQEIVPWTSGFGLMDTLNLPGPEN